MNDNYYRLSCEQQKPYDKLQIIVNQNLLYTFLAKLYLFSAERLLLLSI